MRLDSWDPAGLEGMDAMTRYECSGFVQDVRCLELRVGKQTPNHKRPDYIVSPIPSTSGQKIRHLSLTLDVVGASPTPPLQKRDEKL